ncbi:MAG: 2-hydroxyacid dehydrogenase [Promethearchaeia archaeon]
MRDKPVVYLTSSVFLEISSNEKINPDIRDKIKVLWNKLEKISELHYYKGRFPDYNTLKKDFNRINPNIVGCHLSHPITRDLINDSEIFYIATSTAGYNHIELKDDDDILVSHTPGVLHHTVADYTVALIMANLRNIIDLHNYVWNGNWTTEDKWDLDQDLSSVINNKILGIVGLGEIGTEVVRKLYNWGLNIIYYDTHVNERAEKEFPGLKRVDSLEDIFKKADIVSLHIPLNKYTQNLIDRKYLSLMKKGALLVNTARGGIINFSDLLDMLEKGDIKIDLSFDVYPEEPIKPETLERFKQIKEKYPEIRMILMPHNASADADTRGKMDIIFLNDIIKVIESSKIEDLEQVHIIPEQRKILYNKKWKIEKYWSLKNS